MRATAAAMLCGLVNTATIAVRLWSVVSHGVSSARVLYALVMTGALFLRRGRRSIRETSSLSLRALRKGDSCRGHFRVALGRPRHPLPCRTDLKLLEVGCGAGCFCH